jgi:hypothetical protein
MRYSNWGFAAILQSGQRRTKPRVVSRSITTANTSAMSGLTASNLPLVCGVGRSPAEGMPGKGQYSIHTDMLQLLVGGRSGASSLQLSRLRARQGREAKEKVTESAKDYNGKEVLFQPHHPRTVLRGGATQQLSNDSLSRPQLHGSAPP